MVRVRVLVWSDLDLLCKTSIHFCRSISFQFVKRRAISSAYAANSTLHRRGHTLYAANNNGVHAQVSLHNGGRGRGGGGRDGKNNAGSPDPLACHAHVLKKTDSMCLSGTTQFVCPLSCLWRYFGQGRSKFAKRACGVRSLLDFSWSCEASATGIHDTMHSERPWQLLGCPEPAVGDSRTCPLWKLPMLMETPWDNWRLKSITRSE